MIDIVDEEVVAVVSVGTASEAIGYNTYDFCTLPDFDY